MENHPYAFIAHRHAGHRAHAVLAVGKFGTDRDEEV